MPLNNEIIKANKKYEGQFCAICKREIYLGDLIHICPNCQSINHEDCWNNEGGCNSLSCNSLSSNRYSNNSYQNNAQRPQMGGNQRFVSRPGMPMSGGSTPQNMVPCRWCKEPIMRGARKCKHCGEYQRDEDRNRLMQSDGEGGPSSLSVTDWIGVFCCPFIGIIQGAIYCFINQKARGVTLIRYCAIMFFVSYIIRLVLNILTIH